MTGAQPVKIPHHAPFVAPTLARRVDLAVQSIDDLLEHVDALDKGQGWTLHIVSQCELCQRMERICTAALEDYDGHGRAVPPDEDYLAF